MQIINLKVVLFSILILPSFCIAQVPDSISVLNYGRYTPLKKEQALAGKYIPQSIMEKMDILKIKHFGFDSITHIGQIVVDMELSSEIEMIFMELYKLNFPIEKMVPISRYNWSDDLSMEDNNTSCFNYRRIKGNKQLSLHAYGRAIDINPRYNPFFDSYGVNPKNGIYNPEIPGTITSDSKVVEIFKAYGWKWGGDWIQFKDYQHFYKPISN